MEAKPGKRPYVSLEMEQKKEEDVEEGRGRKESNPDVKEEPLEDDFDHLFWLKVREKFNKKIITWSQAMDEVRVERLVSNYEESGSDPKDDPLLVLLKKWPENEKYKGNPRLLASLEYQINRFAEILLKNDFDEDQRYKYFKDKRDPSQYTLLHYAARLNFVHVAGSILHYYPGQLYITSKAHGSNRKFLPVELAIMESCDEAAAFLVKQMKHARVLNLFLCTDNQENPTNFSFKELAENPKMKKTVVAVLDCMVNPHWPYLPEHKKMYSSKQEEDDVEKAWDSVPDDPLSYHFQYHVLDADDCGRLPRVTDLDKEQEEKNVHFNWSCKSALRAIADSDNKGAIQHPVVRLLVKRKWDSYAHFWFSMVGMIYLVFLLCLSFALLYGSTRPDPTQYITRADGLRKACEVTAILMILCYLLDEFNEMEKERCKYFQNVYNYFDLLGMVLILLVIPLRYAHRDEQWILASIGYFFNCLRLFKYSPVTRTTGLYTKTLSKIVYRDVTRFNLVFVVVFITFIGAFYLALRATNTQILFSGFELIMLAGTRGLVEQQPLAEDYTKYKWLPIIVILCYMAVVIVILLNILIAQMSDTYKEAKKLARLQYDVQRMHIITRLEHSRLHRFNPRMRFYKEGDWIDELKLARELLEYSDERHSWESMEEKLDAIRGMMKKLIKRLPATTEQKEK